MKNNEINLGRSKLTSPEREPSVQLTTKKFAEYTRSESFQLDLFQFIVESDDEAVAAAAADLERRRDGGEHQYSQTIELYDFMPKYVWDTKKKRIKAGISSIIRQFECRGIKYELIIQPAGLKNKTTGEVEYYYPGKSEEIVEDVLRKLAVERRALMLDEQVGLPFTVYKVREELARYGHKMSTDQVKKALKVLAKTRLELVNLSKREENSLIFSPIENLGLRGVDDETQSFVVFSPFVSESIKKLNFRLYNYVQVMKYSSSIARQMHKRMAHHFKQASVAKNYEIYLSTVIRDFGLAPQRSMRTNLATMESALKEMVDAGTLLKYVIEKVINSGNRRIEDAKLILTPTAAFSGEVIKANYIEQDNQKRLRGGSAKR